MTNTATHRPDVAALLREWASTDPYSCAGRNAEAALLALGLVPTFGRDGRPVLMSNPATL